MSHVYEHPRPSVTVDCVVFGLGPGDLEVLLVQRGVPPFARKWALPGGFLHMDETLEQAARRELVEETGVCDVFLEQLGAFDALDRDPRERVISVAHYALVKPRDHRLQAGSDASGAAWFALGGVPELAFDHAAILAAARARLQRDVRRRPLGFELLPRKFTLTQLQQLHEIVAGEALDKRNFRKKVLATGLLVATGETEEGVAHRAARLYRFDRIKYDRLAKRGYELAI